MMAKRNDPYLREFNKLLETLQDVDGKRESISNNCNKLIGDIREANEKNLAKMKKQTEELEAKNGVNTEDSLKKKLHALQKERKQLTKQMDELQVEFNDLTENGFHNSEKDRNDTEHKLVERNEELTGVITRSKSKMLRNKVEVELLATTTGVYFEDNGIGKTALIIDNQGDGNPCMKTVTFDDDSTDEVQVVDKMWDAIASTTKKRGG